MKKEPNNLIREWTWMKSNNSNLWHVETADTRETIISTPKGYLAQFIASAPDLLKERDEFKEKYEITYHNLTAIANERDKAEQDIVELKYFINQKDEIIKREIALTTSASRQREAYQALSEELLEALKLAMDTAGHHMGPRIQQKIEDVIKKATI